MAFGQGQTATGQLMAVWNSKNSSSFRYSESQSNAQIFSALLMILLATCSIFVKLARVSFLLSC